MTTLQRAIKRGLGWSRSERRVAIHGLANDFQIDDVGAVARIFDAFAARIRTPGLADDDVVRMTLDAANALAKRGIETTPIDEAALERFLSEMPEPDRTIIREYRSGKSHGKIAAQLGMQDKEVLCSLSRTYADLRMKMIGLAAQQTASE